MLKHIKKHVIAQWDGKLHFLLLNQINNSFLYKKWIIRNTTFNQINKQIFSDKFQHMGESLDGVIKNLFKQKFIWRNIKKQSQISNSYRIYWLLLFKGSVPKKLLEFKMVLSIYGNWIQTVVQLPFNIKYIIGVLMGLSNQSNFKFPITKKYRNANEKVIESDEINFYFNSLS